MTTHIADKFLLRPDTLESAVARGMDPQRVSAVLDGLAHELGGIYEMRRWLDEPNAALDGIVPMHLLVEGRIDVLERIHRALKGLQFA